MKSLFGIFIVLFSKVGMAKSVALSVYANGVYSFEYQLKPKRTVGLLYAPINSSDDTYKYEGASYGISLSTKDFTDGVSFDLLLLRDNSARFQCASCDKEKRVQYSWAFSFQNSWVWNWGLYIYAGAGFYYQYKTYDYRGSSFIGPQFFIPLGLGFSF
jgi:hypothetical protein